MYQRRRIGEINRKVKSLNLQKKEVRYVTLDESYERSMQQLDSPSIEFRALELEDPGCLEKLAEELNSVTFRVLSRNAEVPFPDSQFVQLQHPDAKEWCLIDRDKGRITKSQDEPFDNIPVIYADS